MATMLRNVSVKEAIACFAGIRPVAPKRVPLAAAAGLRLAEDVVARRAQPFEPRAARNGFAVAAAAVDGATPRRPRPLREDAQLLDTGALLRRREPTRCSRWRTRPSIRAAGRRSGL